MPLETRPMLPFPGSPSGALLGIMSSQAEAIAKTMHGQGVTYATARAVLYNVMLAFFRTEAGATDAFTIDGKRAVAAFVASFALDRAYGSPGADNFELEIEVEFDFDAEQMPETLGLFLTLMAIDPPAPTAPPPATVAKAYPQPPVIGAGTSVQKGGRTYQVRLHEPITDRVLLLGYGWVDRAELDPVAPLQVPNREAENARVDALTRVRPATDADWDDLRAALADYDDGDEEGDENAEPDFSDAEAEPVITEALTPPAPVATSIVWVAPTPVPLAPPPVLAQMTQPVVPPPPFDLNAAVSAVLLDWTRTLKSFTAFDVTTCLRQAHPSERILHRDVRPLVHAAMANQRIYTRENVSTPGGLAIQYQPL